MENVHKIKIKLENIWIDLIMGIYAPYIISVGSHLLSDGQFTEERGASACLTLHMLGHICLYAYMHKVNPNIFPYFLSFYLCITILSVRYQSLMDL